MMYSINIQTKTNILENKFIFFLKKKPKTFEPYLYNVHFGTNLCHYCRTWGEKVVVF